VVSSSFKCLFCVQQICAHFTGLNHFSHPFDFQPSPLRSPTWLVYLLCSPVALRHAGQLRGEKGEQFSQASQRLGASVVARKIHLLCVRQWGGSSELSLRQSSVIFCDDFTTNPTISWMNECMLLGAPFILYACHRPLSIWRILYLPLSALPLLTDLSPWFLHRSGLSFSLLTACRIYWLLIVYNFVSCLL